MKRKCSIPTPLGNMDAVAEQDALRGSGSPVKNTSPKSPWTGWKTRTTRSLRLCAGSRRLFRGKASRLRPADRTRGDTLSDGGVGFAKEYTRGDDHHLRGPCRATGRGPRRTRPSAQAVGGAVGHNPLTIIVPCHRVVGANGSLTGYAGGLDRKAALLALEGVDNLPKGA